MRIGLVFLIAACVSCRNEAPETTAGSASPPVSAAEVVPEVPADPGPPTPEEAKPETAGAAVPRPEYPLQTNPLAGCTLCHVDVEDEYVGTIHFDEQVGCSSCHGPSKEHLADENNEVKPDEVFARENVDRLCEHCHECFRPKAEKPEVTADGKPKVCTDCHGPHDVALTADATASGLPQACPAIGRSANRHNR